MKEKYEAIELLFDSMKEYIIKNLARASTQIALQFALPGRTTADKREIKDFPKLPQATSFIRQPLYEIAAKWRTIRWRLQKKS